MERITADVIAEKEFTIESRGYNKDEVDTFLDLICEELDRLNNEIQDLRQKTTIVRTAAPAESPASNTKIARNAPTSTFSNGICTFSKSMFSSGMMSFTHPSPITPQKTEYSRQTRPLILSGRWL